MISDIQLERALRELWDLGHHATTDQLADKLCCYHEMAQRMVAEMRKLGWVRMEPESRRGAQYFYTALLDPRSDQGEPVKDARQSTGWRERTCLRCGESFPSESPANRRCGDCTTQVRNAQDLPIDAPGWEYVSA